jgi:hypothetical protein
MPIVTPHLVTSLLRLYCGVRSHANTFNHDADRPSDVVLCLCSLVFGAHGQLSFFRAGLGRVCHLGSMGSYWTMCHMGPMGHLAAVSLCLVSLCAIPGSQ